MSVIVVLVVLIIIGLSIFGTYRSHKNIELESSQISQTLEKDINDFKTSTKSKYITSLDAANAELTAAQNERASADANDIHAIAVANAKIDAANHKVSLYTTLVQNATNINTSNILSASIGIWNSTIVSSYYADTSNINSANSAALTEAHNEEKTISDEMTNTESTELANITSTFNSAKTAADNAEQERLRQRQIAHDTLISQITTSINNFINSRTDSYNSAISDANNHISTLNNTSITGNDIQSVLNRTILTSDIQLANNTKTIYSNALSALSSLKPNDLILYAENTFNQVYNGTPSSTTAIVDHINDILNNTDISINNSISSAIAAANTQHSNTTAAANANAAQSTAILNARNTLSNNITNLISSLSESLTHQISTGLSNANTALQNDTNAANNIPASLPAIEASLQSSIASAAISRDRTQIAAYNSAASALSNIDTNSILNNALSIFDANTTSPLSDLSNNIISQTTQSINTTLSSILTTLNNRLSAATTTYNSAVSEANSTADTLTQQKNAHDAMISQVTTAFNSSLSTLINRINGLKSGADGSATHASNIISSLSNADITTLSIPAINNKYLLNTSTHDMAYYNTLSQIYNGVLSTLSSLTIDNTITMAENMYSNNVSPTDIVNTINQYFSNYLQDTTIQRSLSSASDSYNSNLNNDTTAKNADMNRRAGLLTDSYNGIITYTNNTLNSIISDNIAAANNCVNSATSSLSTATSALNALPNPSTATNSVQAQNITTQRALAQASVTRASSTLAMCNQYLILIHNIDTNAPSTLAAQLWQHAISDNTDASDLRQISDNIKATIASSINDTIGTIINTNNNATTSIQNQYNSTISSINSATAEFNTARQNDINTAHDALISNIRQTLSNAIAAGLTNANNQKTAIATATNALPRGAIVTNTGSINSANAIFISAQQNANVSLGNSTVRAWTTYISSLNSISIDSIIANAETAWQNSITPDTPSDSTTLNNISVNVTNIASAALVTILTSINNQKNNSITAAQNTNASTITAAQNTRDNAIATINASITTARASMATRVADTMNAFIQSNITSYNNTINTLAPITIGNMLSDNSDASIAANKQIAYNIVTNTKNATIVTAYRAAISTLNTYNIATLQTDCNNRFVVTNDTAINTQSLESIISGIITYVGTVQQGLINNINTGIQQVTASATSRYTSDIATIDNNATVLKNTKIADINAAYATVTRNITAIANVADAIRANDADIAAITPVTIPSITGNNNWVQLLQSYDRQLALAQQTYNNNTLTVLNNAKTSLTAINMNNATNAAAASWTSNIDPTSFTTNTKLSGAVTAATNAAIAYLNNTISTILANKTSQLQQLQQNYNTSSGTILSAKNTVITTRNNTLNNAITTLQQRVTDTFNNNIGSTINTINNNITTSSTNLLNAQHTISTTPANSTGYINVYNIAAANAAITKASSEITLYNNMVSVLNSNTSALTNIISAARTMFQNIINDITNPADDASITGYINNIITNLSQQMNDAIQNILAPINSVNILSTINNSYQQTMAPLNDTKASNDSVVATFRSNNESLAIQYIDSMMSLITDAVTGATNDYNSALSTYNTSVIAYNTAITAASNVAPSATVQSYYNAQNTLLRTQYSQVLNTAIKNARLDALNASINLPGNTVRNVNIVTIKQNIIDDWNNGISNATNPVTNAQLNVLVNTLSSAASNSKSIVINAISNAIGTKISDANDAYNVSVTNMPKQLTSMCTVFAINAAMNSNLQTLIRLNITPIYADRNSALTDFRTASTSLRTAITPTVNAFVDFYTIPNIDDAVAEAVRQRTALLPTLNAEYRTNRLQSIVNALNIAINSTRYDPLNSDLMLIFSTWIGNVVITNGSIYTNGGTNLISPVYNAILNAPTPAFSVPRALLSAMNADINAYINSISDMTAYSAQVSAEWTRRHS